MPIGLQIKSNKSLANLSLSVGASSTLDSLDSRHLFVGSGLQNGRSSEAGHGAGLKPSDRWSHRLPGKARAGKPRPWQH